MLGRRAGVAIGIAQAAHRDLLLKRLDEIGFKGEYIIEREIHGEQQAKDILETIEYLKKL